MADDVVNMSFEQALLELNSIVSTLETGKESLEKLVGLYERGMSLKRHCESKLNEAKMKINTINDEESNES